MRVASVNFRPVVKDDAEVRFVPEGRSSVQRRLAILVARPDVGASANQEFRDGRVLPPQYRLEERRPPVPVAGVGVRTAQSQVETRRGSLAMTASNSFRSALTTSSSFGA